MTPEGLIKRAICDYLSTKKDVFFWVNESVGIFDPRRKIFLKKNSKYQIKGVSDILGIWEGQPIAIEVKSEKGRVSPDQKIFLERFKKEGGIAFVARSVEDAMKVFEVKAGDFPDDAA